MTTLSQDSAKRVYLLAYPAGHSLSPAMQGAAFAALELPSSYQALEVPPEALPEAVAALRAPDVWGANVTIPHKEAVLPLLDALSPEAQAIGAVNTVVNTAGRLEGHNTDAAGFLRALADGGFYPEGKRALLLGAGGAARAVAYALLSAGAGRLEVHNRHPARAEALARDFGRLGDSGAVTDEGLEGAVRRCDLLVNSTPVGMARGGQDPDTSPLPCGLLPERGFVSDLVYRPARTRLLRDAEAAGLRTQGGLPMLVYQGALAFVLWTGQPAPVPAMREAALRAL